MARFVSTSLPVAAPTRPAPLDAFLDDLRRAIDAGTLASLVLSKPRDAGTEPSAVRIRLIDLKGTPALSFVASHATRDLTRNLSVGAGIAEVAALLDPGRASAFAHATLHAADGDLQLLVSKKGKATLRRHAPATGTGRGSGAASGVAHDRARERRLPLDLPFLSELGITDANHRLVPSMARKWRQIDKFLEVLDHALEALPAAPPGGGSVTPIRVVDYGCGKGYLTFAVHEHLRRRFGSAPQVLGVELRADLVDFCNDVARRSGCIGLSFVAGDLRSVAPAAMDVMIALHACDTATDHAIDLGLRAGAQILVCSPCCHKELRPQIARPRLLSGLLRHGIHLGQEAEMVTDSMRALLLETCGYDAQVFEFVSLEHTSKNKMILAKRRSAGTGQEARARSELADLKTVYGIREQCLESLLQRQRAVAGDAAPQACQTP
ncbi:MAG: SAM-dependent methyltransferase [Pseudomonadota bacterium]|nr:SAM-dependent methyltransferase [Pseudomonadota bacterium]